MGYEKSFTTRLDRTITVSRSGEGLFLKVDRTGGESILSVFSLEEAETLEWMLEEARFWEPPNLPAIGTAVAARGVHSGDLIVGRYMGGDEVDSESVRVRGYRGDQYGTFFVDPESVEAL